MKYFSSVLLVLLIAISVFAQTGEIQKAQIMQNYVKIPLAFTANSGQMDSKVKFTTSGNGAKLFFIPPGRVFFLGRESIASEKRRNNRESAEQYFGDVVQDTVIVLEMVSIPAGEFIMGSNSGDNDEKPVRKVSLDSFYIGKYEVTQREWSVVMGYNPSKFKGYGLPVENLSWNEIQIFLQKLSDKTGKKYRLPTEAEWEYACSAGSTAEFCFGDVDRKLDEYAWYNKNSKGKTHQVGRKKPNAWGLHDMHGNVWEWCEDWYSSNKKRKTLRGGGWRNESYALRSANRNFSNPNYRKTNSGFRCIREH